MFPLVLGAGYVTMYPDFAQGPNLQTYLSEVASVVQVAYWNSTLT